MFEVHFGNFLRMPCNLTNYETLGFPMEAEWQVGFWLAVDTANQILPNPEALECNF